MSVGTWRKIGDVAEELGVTARTLRFYEEEGLIAACRTQGGTRLYNDEHVARFKAILDLANAGTPIALIRKLATLRTRHDTGAASSRAVEGALQEIISSLDTQIDALKQLTVEAHSALASLGHCHACQNPPTRNGCPKCAMNRLATENDLLALVWEQSACQK